jgi:hypothetical protein
MCTVGEHLTLLGCSRAADHVHAQRVFKNAEKHDWPLDGWVEWQQHSCGQDNIAVLLISCFLLGPGISLHARESLALGHTALEAVHERNQARKCLLLLPMHGIPIPCRGMQVFAWDNNQYSKACHVLCKTRDVPSLRIGWAQYIGINSVRPDD